MSFFAFIYEKIRNAVEFREEHLVRRAAIERILNRRMSLNQSGKGEGENLCRELLWARYISSDALSDVEAAKIQTIIDKYYYFKKQSIVGKKESEKSIIAEFLFDLMTCEIEEALNPAQTRIKAAKLYFFYQVLKNKVQVEKVSQEVADSYFYVASEQAYAKNDRAYTRYHLFCLLASPVHMLKHEQIDRLATYIKKMIVTITQTMHNPYDAKLVKFAKRQTPAFHILFTIADRYPTELPEILSSASKLRDKVNSICVEKYRETSAKLRIAAIRSIVYIFLTKAIFALILEYPLTTYIYGSVHYSSLIINAVFPPILMALLVSVVQVPGADNTKKIYERIIDIVNKDTGFEMGKSLIAKKSRVRRPFLLFIFTVIYLLTFGLTFYLIYLALSALNFNVISMGVFVFFISLVVFFGYRVRQTAKEYTISDKRTVLSPIADFFFIPILFVGRYLSQEIAKFNILMLVFDFLIEAPFKMIAEIVEEWIGFLRARKEEIV